MTKEQKILQKVGEHIGLIRRHVDDERLLRLFAVSLMLISILMPAAGWILDLKSYQLNAESLNVIGKANDNLVKKFTYDTGREVWQFNKGGSAVQQALAQQNAAPGDKGAAGLAGALAQMKSQVGGDGAKDQSLYSADLATDPTKGVTYYDNNTDLSFSVVPQFKVHKGKLWQGRVIYPVNSNVKLVYTAKNNGMKEDVVLQKAESNSIILTYKLNLPKELEARLNDDGSLGVYSADPALYGNITYSSDADQEKVMSARQTAVKDHLVFAVPPPQLKDAKGVTAPGVYNLQDGVLTVAANNLRSLHYPLSLDPSVVVTSTSDFGTGNNEDNISFDTNAISNNTQSGGAAGTFVNTAPSFTSIRMGQGSVVYNGRVYVVGGYDGTTYYNTIQYSAMSSNGTIGSWSAIGNTAFDTNGRYNHTVIAYNGYMYVIGGIDSTGSAVNTVRYAPINASTGAVTGWASTTAFSTARSGHTSIVYNGYLYILGGWDGTTYYNDVQYTPINANGSLSSSPWGSTSSFTTVRASHSSVVNNGFVYVIGGWNGSTIYGDIQYAPLNADGTVGTWASTTSLAATRYGTASVAYKGYLYVTGGNSGAALATVSYAALNANGTVGAWTNTSTFATPRYNHTMVAANGWLYVIGGWNGTTYLNTVRSSPLTTPGSTGLSTVGPGLLSAAEREGHTSVAYKGCLYVLGGSDQAGTDYGNAQYLQLTNTGVTGSWTTTTGFTPLNQRVNASAAAYNGYLYVMGGSHSGTFYDDILYVAVNPSTCATSGSWSRATGHLPAGIRGQASVAYNGYIYSIGGYNGTNDIDTVSFGQIDSSTGDVTVANGGGGTTLTSAGSVISNARRGIAAVVSGGYIYVSGGYNAGVTTYYNDVQYAAIGSTGTVGSWTTSANTFTTARYAHAMTVYNNVIYVTGGYDGTTYYGDVQYAPILSSGDIGSWTATTSLNVPKAWHTTVAYNGFLYTAGGQDSTTVYATSQYVRINNNNGGTVGTWSANTTAYVSTARYFLSSVAYNGYLYALGGSNGSTYYNDVRYSPIDATAGSATSWASTSSFINARDSHTAVAYNGYMYLIGGYDGTNFYNDVQYAPINSNGSLGAWHYTHSSTDDSTSFVSGFTTGRHLHASAVYNGYLYVIGGLGSAASLADVQYAPLNANGTVGTWSSSTSLGGNRYYPTALANNGYLYVIGGRDASGTAVADVFYAPINGNGTIGSWLSTTSLNFTRYAHSAVVYNGCIYVVGGLVNGAVSNDIQFASINANGTIGAWSSTTGFTTARHGIGVAASNGYLYIMGGKDGGTTYDNHVQFAPLNIIAHRSQYSTVVNIGGTSNANVAVGYNGTLGPASTVQYRVADSTGVLGALTSGTSGTVTAAGSCNPYISAVQFVWIVIELDDSYNASVSADASRGSLTDVTVSYTPSNRSAPGSRLYGGKYYSNQALQGLDTCGP